MGVLGVLSLAVGFLVSAPQPQSIGFQEDHPAQKPYWTFHVGAGRTLLVLGSTDVRNNAFAGLQYAKPEKHFRIGKHSGEMLQEIYYEHSGSKAGSGYRGGFPSQYDAAGYLFGSRYTWGLRGAYKIYTDLGLGLYYDTERTEDLPSRLNTTPFIDLGLIIPNGANPLTVGLRLLHVSNGGVVAPNAGQNQLFLDLGVRF